MKEPKLTCQPIMCPHCHAQYHPSEIFMPGDFLGKPDNLIKDALGKILYEDYQEGHEPSFSERFECEECGKPFFVDATVTYKTREVPEEQDFSTEYSSLY